MGMQMMESIIELLFGLSLSTLILLIGSCILGSISAALRAVSRESDREREDVKEVFALGAEVTGLDDRMVETGVIVMTNPGNHYGL
jgi:type II secretory pathway component PulJ